MPPTKKEVWYRPGATCGWNNCSRCVNFRDHSPDNGIRSRCAFLEAPVKREHTCELFVEDPEWRNPYEL
ncbi:MAG: hypothetical protein P1S46_06245 [bacterium]|nr:hypothetical protein [bacterium]